MNRRRWQVIAFVFAAWALMPVIALWLMLTHPGKCALIWKRELTGTWFK